MPPLVHQSEDEDSDSSSCDVDTFSAVCDPTLGDAYLRTKHVDVTDCAAAVERVTGDADIDNALRDVKKACRTFERSRNSTPHVPQTEVHSVRVRTPGASYMVSLANSFLEKRILVEDDTHPQAKASPAPAETSLLEDEEFKLLPDVSVSSRAEDDLLPQVSPEWLRKLQRRHGFSFFHPDEEECLEERCKEVALNAEFIANRGLAIPYAEHRNVNPKKLIRIKLASTESNQRTESKKKKIKSSNSTTTDIAGANEASVGARLKEGSQTHETQLQVPDNAFKLNETEQNKEISSASTLSKKKKKARKRGLKKGRKKTKLSETRNGL